MRLAPKATAREIVVKVNASLADSLRSAKVKEILAASGAEPGGGTPEALGRFLQSEIVKWGKVVRAAGITPE
jgi:tripartite-type tricarboxylate transporter receptor subunit TctC